METKRITNLDSLMIFTGANANKNAQALEDRQYDIFSDEYIGKLLMNKDFDSVFSNTQSEIFVETTPKYKSIKDITEIAYAYLTTKSSVSPLGNMYIDDNGLMNFLYNFEDDLDSNLDNDIPIPQNDISLYLATLNNAMYNKQKYYSQRKEVESLSNVGIKYWWRPQGSYFNVYDVESKLDTKIELNNDFISYTLDTIDVEETKWDELTNSYVPVYDVYEETRLDDNNEEYTYSYNVPRITKKNVLSEAISFNTIIDSKLTTFDEIFRNRREESLLSYYISDLNSTLSVVANTYTFGQNTINVNINYDGEFNNWFYNRISFGIKDFNGSEICKVTPGENYWFNLAINENERFIGDDVNSNEEVVFTYNDEGSFNNISILSPYKIKKIDLSPVAQFITGELNLVCDYDKKINSTDTVSTNWIKERGNMLEELIIGKEGINCQLTNIIGLDNFTNLKKIDLTGCNNLINNPDLSVLPELDTFILDNTNISVFNPFVGSVLEEVKLPDCVESIILNEITFKNGLDYNINDNLTTLELNNVVGIDTKKFISDWVDSLIESNKLDSGLVNYVNINGVDWNDVDYNLLLNLKTIELNEFTGNINVCGSGLTNAIYRKDYQDLVNAFGQENVLTNGKEGDTDLKINVTLANRAYDIKMTVMEIYNESSYVENEYGGWDEVVETKERLFRECTINVLDNVSGNSLIDMIDDESFTNIQKNTFINANNIGIGLTFQLSNPLVLPTKSEKLDKVEIGDVLLFNKQTIILVTKNAENINQNFTKLGKFEDIDTLLEIMDYEFDQGWYYSFESMEEEIEIPIVDEDNFIEIEYGEKK